MASHSSVLVGSALVLGAAAAAFQFSSAASNHSRKIEGDVTQDEDFITADEVARIFDRLFLEMQAVVAQLSQQVRQIQMSGQHIPAEQLRMLVRGEFERALAFKQTMILQEFDIDEDCLEEATWEFLGKGEGYEQVRTAVEKFQLLWEMVSGETVVGKRPGQSPNEKDSEPTDLPDLQTV